LREDFQMTRRNKGVAEITGLCAFCLALACPSYGQRGTPGPNPNTPVTSTMRSGPEHDIAHFRSLDCKIVGVDTDYGTIAVEDKKGNKMQFVINKKTRLKADKETELADKKKFELADFKNGQKVTVTFQLGDKIATEVKLRRSEG
jgi:hypothetical protein